MIKKKYIHFLPNTLTALRILLTPICIYYLYSSNFILALILFLIASLTDFFDGYFARKYNTISKIGIFLDPLADKMLVIGLFLSFFYLGIIIDWIILSMIIFRDIFVTILRILIQSQGMIMITSKVAKLKTAIQFLIIIILFIQAILPITFNENIIYYISLIMGIFTFYTGFHYLLSNLNQLKLAFKNE